MLAQLFGALLALSTVSQACDPGHGSKLFAKRIQPGSTEAISYPTRELEWSDINFISTTDTHGWLVGHQKNSEPEPNYSGDFGDFSSFVHWMKKKAIEKDVDLLLIDSGDLHDGNGLSDGAVPLGETDGVQSSKIFAQLPYDVLAIGNHELYIKNVTLDVHYNFAPQWKGRYLSSNANLTIVQDGKNVSLPVGGKRFSKFKTRKGKKVTAFGILYAFTGQWKGATVTPPASMVNETWFLDAIKEAPDLFVLAGHMPVNGVRGTADFDLVFEKIRAIHPSTPIYIFGGHTHIRDCQQMDGRSMSIESGRYMETIGWMSSNLPAADSTSNLTISRRYIDTNRNSYAWHTKRDGVFDTLKGINITQQMQNIVTSLDISTPLGTVPKDYYLQRSPYGSNDSVLTFLTDELLPKTIVDSTRNNSKIVIVNSGSTRYDVFAGPFSSNDNYIVSPFLDSFLYYTMPYSVAIQILPGLNKTGVYKRSLQDRLEDPFARAQRLAWENYVRDGSAHSNLQKRSLELAARATSRNATLTLGYVTEDSCPGLGDDVLHTPIPYSSDVPGYIGTANPTGLADNDPVDVVFLDFFASSIAPLINSLVPGSNVTAAEAKTYGPASGPEILRTDTMFIQYAEKFWN